MRFLVAHAAWREDRRASVERLVDDVWASSGKVTTCEVVASRGPEHAAIWARRLWERAAKLDEHVVILNDDVVLLPDFHARVERMIAAIPDEPISLHCTNPAVLPYAADGHAWVRAYHYTGPAVVLPPGAAADLCRFVYGLPWSLTSRANEDIIASMWAWDRQRPFWYALPSPVTHDTSVLSTLGYDNHPNRIPVALDGPEPDWCVTERWRVPFVELSWLTTPGLEYQRRVLRAGRHLCATCAWREGVVGRLSAGVMLCLPCLSELQDVAERGPEP